MKWCHDRDLRVLLRDPPDRTVRWASLVLALERTGGRVVETEGFHLSVERGGRVARFHHAAGIARGYQLEALRAFLEETA